MHKQKSNKMQQCTKILFFHIYMMLSSVPENVHQLHVHQSSTVLWKIRGCQCSFMLLMMGGASPETCWASYKYGIITFWYIVASCWIFFTNCTMMHGSMNIKFITPRIFTLVATLKWIFSLTPPPLYHRGNIPSHPPVMH